VYCLKRDKKKKVTYRLSKTDKNFSSFYKSEKSYNYYSTMNKTISCGHITLRFSSVRSRRKDKSKFVKYDQDSTKVRQNAWHPHPISLFYS